MSKIVCANLSFSWPDGTPVFTDLTFAVGAGRTGLVAPNGAGKSTLLRLVAGELHARTAGPSPSTGLLGYLPQTLPLTGEPTVAEVLEIAPVDRARSPPSRPATRARSTSPSSAPTGTSRNAPAPQLDRLGLGDVTLDRPLGTLSGGQVVSLGLAAQLLKQPDVLLLDEPTNNLDRDARHRLYDVLGDWKGCLLLVSHDRALLDRMDRIAELDAGPARASSAGTSPRTRRRSRPRGRWPRRTCAAPNRTSSGRSGSCSRRGNGRPKRASNGARTNTDIPRIIQGGLKRRPRSPPARPTTCTRSGSRRRRRAAGRGGPGAAGGRHARAVPAGHRRCPAGRTVFHGERIRVRDLFAATA